MKPREEILKKDNREGEAKSAEEKWTSGKVVRNVDNAGRCNGN